ncbi:alpha-N-acetylglucosaminidase TIM-barrel domain-containing protein [Flavobacterium sp. W21_SRS_FM6]|uniref:alpha-N-acetylglucosaminidase n=1 Tax=Flavobacterium sp. W21_SRS_FM6 TaxID=3240268 RepID=UPI003F8E898C
MGKTRLRISTFLTIAFAVLFLTSCNNAKQAPLEQESDTEKSVRDVFQRVSQRTLSNVHFSLVVDNEDDWYQVSAQNGQLTITANVPTALSYGTYQYLRSIGAMAVSWEGSRIAFPQSFDDYQGKKVTSLFQQRAYLNVCAYGYTMPWWDWPEWQKELDWMALHGVNNPVAMEGQEYIWQKLWNEFGVDNDELKQYFSGPAFTPWQRMGNIEGHEGPLPQTWINKKHQLQKQIITRMHALGMQPVVPAFGGYVPKKFISLFPEAKISPMPKWTGFAQETYWLDPADPLFAKVAKRFIELYNQEYGQQQYYLSDSFNEMLPPVSDENRYAELAQYGEKIYQSIQQSAPGATWVMQGWMFGADEEFWDLASIEAFLNKVPDDKVMIHDIGNDRYHVWQRAKGFFNKQWIYGFIHNYGGSNPVYGDFDYYQQQVSELLISPEAGNVTGFGVFPEGINNNSVVYDYMFDLPWNNQGASRDAWLQSYLSARYGQLSDSQLDAWSTISDAVFTTKYWSPRWWEGSAGAYVFTKRPSSKLMDFDDHPTDLAKLDEGIKQLLDSAEALQESSLFIYDLVDFVKQSISLHIDNLLQQSIVLYQQGKSEEGDDLVATIAKLTSRLDSLLGLHDETLGTWIDDAKAYGDTATESAYYALNAKQQITLWGGPNLKDYASKVWQGMYKDFYLPRWTLYLNKIKAAGKPLTDSEEAQAQQDLITWEKDWVATHTPSPQAKPAQPLTDLRQLMQVLELTQKVNP